MRKSDFIDDINCIVGNFESLITLLNNTKNHFTFEAIVKKFICSFASSLMKKAEAKQYPDLIALGYWMRTSNIKKLEERFDMDVNVKVPAGNVIHFAPSNVDTIFIYSLFLSLLVGNRNVVRVSEKSSPQKNILVSLLNDELKKKHFLEIKERLVVISYPHNDFITAKLSKLADIRVIWGGDATVEKISSSPLKSTGSELRFANKYSLAVIDASKFKLLTDEEYENFIKNFVNDTYWFGQQACSSPRSLIWLNSSTNKKAVNEFWRDVESKARKMFFNEFQQVDAMNKIIASHLVAVNAPGTSHTQKGKFLTRIVIPSLASHNKLRDKHCGVGLFFETEIAELSELNGIVDRKTQTISYFGFDPLQLKKDFLKSKIFPDRLVPIGKSLEFDVQWDGNDLLNSFTRIVSFR